MNKRDIIDAPVVVIDPISPDEAVAPDEQLKKEQLGEILATCIDETCCEQHGSPHARWHVGIEMRAPISVRDRFFVTLDVDDCRRLDLGPMSADVANHLLVFVESGIDAKLPGTENGTVSREIRDLVMA